MSWNGHHLVGTFVGILITGLIFTGSIGLNTREGWVAWTDHASAPAPNRTASLVIGTEAVMVAAPAPAAATRFTSSCERLQEGILSGTEANIVASMKVVIADGTVDDTSRRVASHYIDRDKGNESQQKRNLLILQDSCKS